MLATMLATGMVVTGMPDMGINLSKVFAETVSTKKQTITEENGYRIEDGVLCAYTGDATDIVIPDGVTKIRSNVFVRNSNITSVVIPGTVKKLEQNVFSNCTKLKKVIMKDGV